MKNIYKIRNFAILFAFLLTNAISLRAQELSDFRFLDKLAILSAGTVEDNNPFSTHGNYGVKNSVTGSHYLNDSIIRNNDFPLLNSYYYLTKIINKYKILSSQISISGLPNGTNLDQGIYSINSATMELNGEVNLTTSDTNEYIVFNISGDLIVDVLFNLNIGNVLPHKIIWNVEGDVFINDSSTFFGIILSNSKIILGNEVQGKLALFSNTEIKLGRSNCLYSISEMGYNKLGRILPGFGDSFAFVCSDGRVQVWGNNEYGQLANGTYGGISTNPIIVPGLTDVISVEVGQTHVLALKKDGTVWAWGNNNSGQLGNNSYFPKYTPVQVLGISNAIGITVGLDCSYALLADGTIKAWGYNIWDLLGVASSNEAIKIPESVPGVTNAKAVLAGELVTYALLNNGEVMAWGNNLRGMLGISNFQSTKVPHLIPNLKDVVQLSTGRQNGGIYVNINLGINNPLGSGHTLALLKDGSVKSWGENTNGCLGIPTNSIFFDENIFPVPNIVPNLNKKVVEVEAGVEISFVRFEDGSMKVWGSTGEFGRGICGTNSWPHYDLNPVDVVSINNVVDISVQRHANHSTFSTFAVILNNGQMKTWGENYDGSLGNGTTNNSCSPVNVNTTCSIIPNPYPNALAQPNFKTQNYHNSQLQSITFVNETKYSTSNVTYLWNFGDGTTLTKNDKTNTEHIYTLPGYYNVTLTAINHFSDNSTVSNSISTPIYIIPSTSGYNTTGCISSYTFDLVDLSSNIINTISNPQHVTSNFTISGTWTILKGTSVIVDNGVTVSFGPLAKVIVEPGAVLKLDGAKFTGVNAGTPCGTFMWLGVEVWGNNLSSNTAEQGKLILTSNSTIEYAHNAVVLGHHALKPTTTGFELNYHDITKGGGIIDARSATFNGNGKSIVFFEYNFPNESIIFGNTFWSHRGSNNQAPLLDPYYNGGNHYISQSGQNPFFALQENGDFGFVSNYHILSYGVKRLRVYNNVFRDAVISFKNYGTSFYLKENDFKEMSEGIYSDDLGFTNGKRSVVNNKFNNFKDYGLHFSNTNLDNVSKNGFNDNNQSSSTLTYGISMHNSTNFKITDNIFKGVQDAISISNKEKTPNTIEPVSFSFIGYQNNGNLFSNCFRPLLVSGYSIGLRIKCNSFINDINYLGANWRINGDLSYQGYSINYVSSLPQVKRPAGNLFDQNTSTPHREISTNIPFNYYAYEEDFTIPTNTPNSLMHVKINNNVHFPNNLVDACSPIINVTYEPDPFLDDIDLLKNRLDTLRNVLDGLLASVDNYGQTSNLIGIILQNEDLSDYKQELIDASPLSDEVLRELILKENSTTTNYNVTKEILQRNLPCSDNIWQLVNQKKDEFEVEDFQILDALNDFNPNYELPAKYIRTINYTDQEKGLILNDVIRLYDGTDDENTADGYVDVDLENSSVKIINLYLAENTKEAKKDLFRFYLEQNKLSEAQDVLNGFDVVSDEDQYFYDLSTIYLTLKNENRSCWDLDSLELNRVTQIAETCPVTKSVSYAKSLLKMIGKETDVNCNGLGQKPNSNILSKGNGIKSKMTAFPIPAKNEVTFLYSLPENCYSAEIVIYNLLGTKIKTIPLEKNRNYNVCDVASFNNGMYIYKLLVNCIEVDSNKIIIQK